MKTRILIFFFVAITKGYSQCVTSGSPIQGQMYTSTGNPEIDSKLNGSKIDLELFFRLKVDLKCFQDNSPNAYANFSSNKLYDGKVMIGINMLSERLWNYEKGEYAIAGILAHEFAHILQIKNQCSLIGKQRELHADFLAGYYFGKRKYLSDGINNFAKDLFDLGDFNFWDPLHHGTPQERVNAFYSGYNSTDLTLFQAYQTGMQVIKDADGNLEASNLNEAEFTKILTKILNIPKEENIINSWKTTMYKTELDGDYKDNFYKAINIFAKAITIEKEVYSDDKINPNLIQIFDKPTGKLYGIEYNITFCGSNHNCLKEEESEKIYNKILSLLKKIKSLESGDLKDDDTSLSQIFVNSNIKLTINYKKKYGKISIKVEYIK